MISICFRPVVVLIVLSMLFGLRTGPAEADAMRLYIGTYTRGESEGIYVADFDSASGRIGAVQLAAKTDEPSFLAIHPNRRFLYAVGETGNYQGEPTGFVRAFAIDAESGKLTELNTVKSDGGAPCHLVVDKLGSTVLVANYSGGNVAAISLLANGRLGAITASIKHEGSSVNRRRQEAPHAHSINLDPANHYAFAADLGIDKVLAYRFDPNSEQRLLQDDAPAAVSVPAGSGPRHFAFHSSGRAAYVINELKSTISVFEYDSPLGKLTLQQTISTLPKAYDGTSHTAEVVCHPSGKFVYGSNRGHDSIAVFEVTGATGELRQVQIEPTGGKTPRNFAVDPSGRFLLAENQGSGTVNVFRIDQATGRLSATEFQAEAPSPVCIRFWAAGK